MCSRQQRGGALELPNCSVADATTTSAAQNLLGQLASFLGTAVGQPTAPETSACRDVLSAIQDFVLTLTPSTPVFASFHDGQVHDPLGGGSYAFRNHLFDPILFALAHDETLSGGGSRAAKVNNETDPRHNAAKQGGSGSSVQAHLPTRPITINAGLQPNNSPHLGTLVVFCYAFAIARGIRDRMQAKAAHTGLTPPRVSVEITFVDTVPAEDQGFEIKGIQYQRSRRDIHGALDAVMADYDEVLCLLSAWSGIPFIRTFQRDFFSQPAIPSILGYIISHHKTLGHELSPEHGVLALRAACPIPGCGLAEKHGRLNVYTQDARDGSRETSPPAATPDATITFFCPLHGQYRIRTSQPAEVARLEANAPARNLIRSMSHLLDADAHHVRVTGADYAGMYQEAFLYRPLAAWSAATGLAAGRTPHILYAPLIVDWSGAKLSKALYVRERGYEIMELLGTDGLCSFARLRRHFGGSGATGLRRVWEEVEGWVGNPRKLFRAYSVEYLQRVILKGEKWE